MTSRTPVRQNLAREVRNEHHHGTVARILARILVAIAHPKREDPRQPRMSPEQSDRRSRHAHWCQWKGAWSMNVLPAYHPQPGVGRCGFCEHYQPNEFHFGAGICALDGDGRSFDLDRCDQFNGNPCDCHACAKVRGRGSRIMILCPTCGNKRCPKASNHELACSGSNLPGQKGSVYE